MFDGFFSIFSQAPVRMTLRLQLRLLRADDVLMLLFFNLWPSSQTMRPKSTFCTWNRDNAQVKVTDTGKTRARARTYIRTCSRQRSSIS